MENDEKKKIRIGGQRRKICFTQQFKIAFFERSVDLVRGFKFEFDVIWEVLASKGTHLIENWTL